MSTDKTENLFEGGTNTDGRQGDENTKPSRFRPVYRNLTPAEKEHHDKIKAAAIALEALLEDPLVPKGRYQSLSLTALEESVMWGVKALTS